MAAALEPQTMRRSGSIPNTNLLRVLVVDDGATSLRILKHLLQQAGYQSVESALSGEDALSKIGACQSPFDLVICDLQMPGMSGLEVLKALRSREDTKDTAVILMSAADSLDVVYRALQAGADYFLIKPVKREMIQNLWQNVAMKRRETKWHSQRDQELEVLRHRVGADLETPITSVLQRIERLMNSPNLTDEVREALLGILKALSSSDLHRPIIHRHMTPDMRVWLDDPLSFASAPVDLGRIVARRQSPLPGTALPAPAPSSPPVAPLTTEIRMERLQSLLQWDFNIFELADKDLEELFPQMLAHLRLIETFRIRVPLLRAFVSRARQSYLPNPYHNFRHAMDVTQAMFFFLNCPDVKNTLLPLEQLSLLVASLCHDLEHPGLSNRFHVETGHSLALRFNDRSVLENHHCIKAFELLAIPECAFLAHLPPSETRDLRRMLIACILATDMAQHLEMLNKIGSVIDSFRKEDSESRLVLMQALLKAADLGNPSRPWAAAHYWATLVLEEWFYQGDQERELGMPISLYCDRTRPPNLESTQIGFIKAVVLPLYMAISRWRPAMATSLSPCLSLLDANLQRWVGFEHSRQSEASPGDGLPPISSSPSPTSSASGSLQSSMVTTPTRLSANPFVVVTTPPEDAKTEHPSSGHTVTFAPSTH